MNAERIPQYRNPVRRRRSHGTRGREDGLPHQDPLGELEGRIPKLTEEQIRELDGYSVEELNQIRKGLGRNIELVSDQESSFHLRQVVKFISDVARNRVQYFNPNIEELTNLGYRNALADCQIIMHRYGRAGEDMTLRNLFENGIRKVMAMAENKRHEEGESKRQAPNLWEWYQHS